MTDVTPLIQAGQKIIQSYAAGKFKINGVYYEYPVIVTSFDVSEWPSASLNSLSPDFFLKWKDDIDVLIIGSGAKGALLMPQKRAEFKEAGFSIEIMDTGAACRTFNVLTAEGRRIAAALLPV